jgi:DNA ligase-1
MSSKPSLDGGTVPTRIGELAGVTEQVRRTSSRKGKSELLARLLGRLHPGEIEPAIGFLLARPRQGAIGVGWATVAGLEDSSAVLDEWSAGLDDSSGAEAATELSVEPPTVLGLDRLLTTVMNTTGAGSAAARAELLNRFLARCHADEVDFVKRVLVGEARQGALAGVITDAAAKAVGAKAPIMRRAVMLQGDLGQAARIGLVDGPEALAAIDLEVQRPILPMLASTASDVADALHATGEASVEWKFDGARIQVHLNAGEVAIYTRNLNPVTDRLGLVRYVVARLQCRSAVLDGEVLGFFSDGTDVPDGDSADVTVDERRSELPNAFQDTMSAFGTRAPGHGHGLRPYFFDLMYLDGESLIDRPLAERAEALRKLVESSGVADCLIPRVITADVAEAEAQLAAALDAGHEGVMVKAVDSTYEAGRRGKSWRKVKPVHTLDLVVLGAEWGSGRRRGWLSNLHLGARDPQTGEFVMVGKTFKGLTDELLAWQTERFLELKRDEHRRPGRHVVMIRPELVVEIALDGVQTSTRYPGGVALRFARVRRYRDDKDPSDADTIDAVRALR